MHSSYFCAILSQIHSLISAFRHKKRGRTLNFPCSLFYRTNFWNHYNTTHGADTLFGYCCLVLVAVLDLESNNFPWGEQTTISSPCLFLSSISVLLTRGPPWQRLRWLTFSSTYHTEKRPSAYTGKFGRDKIVKQWWVRRFPESSDVIFKKEYFQ